MRVMKIISLYLLAFIISVTSSLTTAKAEEVNEVYGNTQRDVMIVFGTGLFGSVLGLSTLSFVEVPEDHLNNIVVGGAWGIILGVGIVAYSQAEKSKDYYYDNYDSQNYNYTLEQKMLSTKLCKIWSKHC